MSAAGYFRQWVNTQAARPGAAEKALVREISETVRSVLPGTQVRWAGSQYKATAIVGSDLDACIERAVPVTVQERAALRAALQAALGSPVTIRSHVLRVAAHGGLPKLDLAFSNAAFGGRQLPDPKDFRDKPARQEAARALKVWTRIRPLPAIPGWVVEALVVHLDPNDTARSGLELFQRIVTWLANSASAPAVEGVLRPAAHPRWNEAWSRRLPGRVQALANAARAQLRARPAPSDWKGPADVAAWMGQ